MGPRHCSDIPCGGSGLQGPFSQAPHKLLMVGPRGAPAYAQSWPSWPHPAAQEQAFHIPINPVMHPLKQPCTPQVPLAAPLS